MDVHQILPVMFPNALLDGADSGSVGQLGQHLVHGDNQVVPGRLRDGIVEEVWSGCRV